MIINLFLCSYHPKTGKNTEVKKQSDVKNWLNLIRFGVVSYSLSCKHRALNKRRATTIKLENSHSVRKNFQKLINLGTLTTYSHLSNNCGGWNKRGRGTKVAKSIKVEGGIF